MSNQKKKKTKSIRRFTGKMQANILLVFCVVFVCFVGLSFRLSYIQKEHGDKYKKRVLSQQTYVSNEIPYKRGDIIDRNNTIIATSEKVYNLVFDIKQMLADENSQGVTLEALTTCFDLDMEELKNTIKEKPNSQYVKLLEQLTYEEIQPFKQMQEENKKKYEKEKEKFLIKGIWFEEEYKRKYPLNTVGSDFVGFTYKGEAGNGVTGSSGLEEYYNSYLNGSNGREYGYYDSKLNLERTVKPAINGNNIVLSVDVNIQRIIEKHIKEFKKTTDFEHMGVVVMNPNNGEIIAMAADEEYDLNNPRDLSGLYSKKEIKAMSEEETLEALERMWRNHIIHDQFEPGSTIKPFTMAMGFEEAILTGNETYVCDGYEMVGGVRINCSKRSGHGTITLKEALMLSCNDAMMQMVTKIGKTRFAKYQDVFGFGLKTGIDLVGERTGAVFTKDTLGPTELATSSFGQSLNTTMIQVATSYSALVNGGYYYQPHLVSQIVNENGAVVEKVGPTLVREVVSRETSEILNDYLFATVDAGTAGGAKVEGYEIGGKTGTAQKLPRSDKTYIVSFIGSVPADKPEIVIYVAIDEPKNVEKQADSKIATVKAGEILAEILPFLELYPEGIDVNKNTATEADENKDGNTGENKEAEANTEEPASTEEGDKESIDNSDDVNNEDKKDIDTDYSYIEDADDPYVPPDEQSGEGENTE